MKQDSIWDHFQNEGVHSFDGAYPRLNFLITKISSGQKVLNIGVGSGELEKLAVEKGIDIYCLDPSSRSIEKIKEELDLGEHAQTGYSQSIPFDNNFFDVVVMSEVLEHLENETLDQTLAEVSRVIRIDGRFLGTVPASEDLSESMVVCPHCDEQFHRWGHVQSFDSNSLMALLQHEFPKTHIETRLFVSWKTLNWKGKFAAFFKLIFSKLGIHGQNENLYFEARKS